MEVDGRNRGVVVRSTGNYYTVQVDFGGVVDCKVKGNFRLKGIKSTNPVAVGDIVEIEKVEGGIGYIVSIEDRKNYIIRKSSNLSKQSHILAANIDLLLLIVTPSFPETSTTFIDRVIASAEAYDIPVLLVFNKVDLYTLEDAKKVELLRELYKEIGYEVSLISCKTKQGISSLTEFLKGKTTLLAGHSGVGKSSLINHLIPDAKAKTKAISETHKMGVHTTTFSERYSLPGGGFVIDVPGVKGFGCFDMGKDDISHFFKEIFKISDQCRFSDCTHLLEPGCAVLKALENGEIKSSRYRSYLSILEEREEEKYRKAY